MSTLEGRPTAPPENLSAVALNSTTLEASWTPPNQQFINGYNLGYKVYYKKKEALQMEAVVVVPQDSSNPTAVQKTKLSG